MVRGQLWTVGCSINDSREPIGDHFDEANAEQTQSQKTEHDRSGQKANRATHIGRYLISRHRVNYTQSSFVLSLLQTSHSLPDN